MAFENDFAEFTVKKKADVKDGLIKKGFIAFMVLIAAAVFIIPGLLSFIFIAAVLEVGLFYVYRYVIFPMTEVEYEYSYCEKEISIDKVLNMENRKHIADYELEKMTIMAPASSNRLDAYKNLKEYDFSSKTEGEGYSRYVLVYENKQKVLLDLSADFVRIVQNNAPSKVFTV
ncbi:MAG: DUF6106 family protein [Lachnospiraceae bacterium]|nr:DUF6106 family protein [Lachnospiraceae bacterium]